MRRGGDEEISRIDAPFIPGYQCYGPLGWPKLGVVTREVNFYIKA
jgi:hypothetical protein